VIISLVDHNENIEFESIGKIVQIIDHHKKNPNTRLPLTSSFSGVTQLLEQKETEPQGIYLEEQLVNEKNEKGGRRHESSAEDVLTDNKDWKEEVTNNKSNISHGIYSNNSHHKTDQEKTSSSYSVFHSILDSEINERVGSCSSLVAKRYFHSLRINGNQTILGKQVDSNHRREQQQEDPLTSTSSPESDSEEVDVQVALLLYGPVILGEFSLLSGCLLRDLFL
jgi:hypothetical protein